jgi:hypothetical protein
MHTINPNVPWGGVFNGPPPSHHCESLLHKIIERVIGFPFDCSQAVDCMMQWTDYSGCSLEVKEGAGRVKGAIDRVNVVFSGLAAVFAIHELLDADDNSVGIKEVTGVLGSGAGFVDRLEGLGAINLAEGVSPIIAGIGAVADVVGGVYDSTNVIWGNSSIEKPLEYKALKVIENVAFIALSILSGIAAGCAACAVAAPVLSFTLLVVGSVALSIKMIRHVYDDCVNSPRFQAARDRARVVRLTGKVTKLSQESAGLKRENAGLKRENAELKQENAELKQENTGTGFVQDPLGSLDNEEVSVSIDNVSAARDESVEDLTG